jgi:ACR3 family arsenite transporter
LRTFSLQFPIQEGRSLPLVVTVLLIAAPIIVQVYFNSGLTYLLVRWFRLIQKGCCVR